MKMRKCLVFILLSTLLLTGCTTTDVETGIDRFVTNFRENIERAVENFEEKWNIEKDNVDDAIRNRQLDKDLTEDEGIDHLQDVELDY